MAEMPPLEVHCPVCATAIVLPFEHGPHLVRVGADSVGICMRFDRADLAAHMFTHQPGVQEVSAGP